MAESGTLVVRTFVSRAQLPISGAAVIVSAPQGDGRHKLLSIQITDQSGTTQPIRLEAPDTSGSLSPGNGNAPFSSYTLVVEHPDYQLAVFDRLQIFPGVETVQNVPLIPLSVGGRDQQELTTITPQPL